VDDDGAGLAFQFLHGATRSAGVVQQFQRRACRVSMQVVVQRVMKRA
jgi:hypothetical protein